MFCEAQQDLPSGILIEQRVYEAVRSIDDIDHEELHFVVVQTRDFGPRNDTVSTADGNIRVVPDAEDGEVPAWRSSSIELRKHCRTMYFARRR